MMKYVYFAILICAVAGCSHLQTFGDDYMGAEDYHKETLSEALLKFKTECLRAEVSDADKTRRAELMAYDVIMATEHHPSYRVLEPQIDTKVIMPEATPYIFVHFLPKPDIPEVSETTFLIVFSRFYDKVVYSGLYTPPGGDSFYRYHDIVKELKL